MLPLLVVHLLVLPALAIWPFPPKRFNGNSLVIAGTMGLNADRVVAFGDFNGDQFLDALALDSDQKTLSVYLWNHEAFIFQKASSFQHPDIVQNVVPGDFTHSGKLDLLVMGHKSPNQLDMLLYPALPEGGFDSDHPISVPPSGLAQPIPLDLNGDMRIDLLGSPPSNSSMQVWYNVWDSDTPNSPLFNVTSPTFNTPTFATPPQCTLANPHSNAVVDLDGDCLADLFLICTKTNGQKFFQIWVNQKSAGFQLSLTGDLPDGIGAVSFADVDRDGTIDLVFPTCESVSSSTGIGQKCSINVAFNRQLPLCTSDSSSECRHPENLCTADPSFKFDLANGRGNDGYSSVKISDLFPGSSDSLLIMDTSTNPPTPIPLKLGDADLDGFPDLLIITAPSDASKPGGTPKLLFNVACDTPKAAERDRGVVAGCEGQARRGWRALIKDVESMSTITDARAVSFLDIDEDGTMDIMIQRIGANQNGGKIQFVANNFYYDAFFLKAIVLNGACNNGWCYAPNSSVKYRPLGVSYSGASYKYTILDTNNHRSAAQAAQLPLTSYQSLLTPYAFFGLGRTNNYIENLFVGSTVYVNSQSNTSVSDDTTGHFINIEGVIPNSKVVIFPPPMPARSDKDSGDVSLDRARWKRELFLRPGEWIPWVTVTVVATTAVLAGIVVILHLNEKREDELERRRASHHINFDAL